MMLNTSPRSQTMTKRSERPSQEPRRKFSRICGVKTTIQQDMEMEPEMLERVSIVFDMLV